ncbi:hypothetical protein TRFO_22146 [Tritrichomonas foetus]|uniref:Uncharacterized protein n=1 Tax=Tritrichomonas foetus TaxID=1144522 RepID=A0A1J4KH27_9EUKA|nr:hypothetical protein TRFO_22146 [Tritrichomonas foetus]|eukprot:OHT09132.1 hypothetical protein TRFO_22146 [Tritrichomonas foetus]
MLKVEFSDSESYSSDYSSDDELYVSPKIKVVNHPSPSPNRHPQFNQKYRPGQRMTPNFRRKSFPNKTNTNKKDFAITPIDTPMIDDKIDDYGLNIDKSEKNNEKNDLIDENEILNHEIDWNSKMKPVSQPKRPTPPNAGPKFKRTPFTRRTVRMIGNDGNSTSTVVEKQKAYDLMIDEDEPLEKGKVQKIEDDEKKAKFEDLKEIDDDDDEDINENLGNHHNLHDSSSDAILETKFKDINVETKSDVVDEVEEPEIIVPAEEKENNKPGPEISDMKMLQRYIDKRVPVYNTFDSYMNTKLSFKGRVFEFTFKNGDKDIYRASYVASDDTVMIYNCESQSPLPEYVILIANGRRDFSLRQESITGLESMTVRVAHENAKSLTKHEYTTYLYTKVNMFAPLRMFGRTENGSVNNINFIDSLDLSIAMKATKVSKNFINITATEAVSPLRCFALSIALFLS